MLLTSSEIQKKLERGAFLIHVAHKQIEALQAQIAAHEEQMHDTAQSLYGNPALVEAAIAMANMSIPALEMKASKIVAESQSSTVSTSSEDELNGLLDPSTPAQSSDLDGDDLNGDDDTVVVEPATDGNTLAKLHTEEFFGVEVPASQIELAREIKHEAAVSVKQNTKNNTYASDRGKNAWRKALFTRARAEYLKAGVPSDGAEDPTAIGTVEDTDVIEEAAAEAITEVDAAAADEAVELSVHSATDDVDVAEVETDEPTDLDASVEDDQSTPTGDAIVAVEPEDDHASEAEVVEAELEPGADENLDDADWLPVSEDASASNASDEVAETSSAGFVDIPFFDEESVASADVDETPVEIPSTVNDDHTISITDTFFNDDDVPVLDPISFEEETGSLSGHDDMSGPDEPEDIEVPDFDPNAELFDGDTETVAVEAQAVVADEPVVAGEVAQTFANERIAEATQQMTPEASRRAVSISSLPPHQRPGAPRPQSSIPVRPQPGAASGRVVTVPGPRPSPSAQQQTAVAASPTPATPVAVSPAPAAPAPPAPTRAAPSRGAPSRSGDTPQRAHGYGANVPAPAGLDEAIRERDAAEAAAKAAASSTSSSAPSAPARPSAPPARPSAPRGPAFTKPSFGR